MSDEKLTQSIGLFEDVRTNGAIFYSLLKVSKYIHDLLHVSHESCSVLRVFGALKQVAERSC